MRCPAVSIWLSQNSTWHRDLRIKHVDWHVRSERKELTAAGNVATEEIVKVVSRGHDESAARVKRLSAFFTELLVDPRDSFS